MPTHMPSYSLFSLPLFPFLSFIDTQQYNTYVCIEKIRYTCRCRDRAKDKDGQRAMKKRMYSSCFNFYINQVFSGIAKI